MGEQVAAGFYKKSYSDQDVYIQKILIIDVLSDCMAVMEENQICFLPCGSKELSQSVP